MANPIWPPSLPDGVLQEGYSETFPDNVIRIKMGSGPDKKRRRTTANVTPIDCDITLVSAQVETLKTLYLDDCAGGTLDFDWVHPRTQVVVAFSFAGPPVITAIGGTNYSARFGLEIQP